MIVLTDNIAYDSYGLGECRGTVIWCCPEYKNMYGIRPGTRRIFNNLGDVKRGTSITLKSKGVNIFRRKSCGSIILYYIDSSGNPKYSLIKKNITYELAHNKVNFQVMVCPTTIKPRPLIIYGHSVYDSINEIKFVNK